MSTATESRTTAAGGRQWARVGKLFYSPELLGQDIRRDRSWWLPFLITVILVYGLSIAAAHRVGFEQLTLNVLRAQGTSDPQTSDVAGSAQPGVNFRNSVMVFEASSYAAPLIIIIYNVMYALLLQLAFRLVTGAQASFSMIFAVLLYCDLIQDVRTVMSAIVLFLSAEPNSYNLQNPVGTNLGYYIGAGYPAWARVLFEAADIITIWYLLIIALGCAAALKVERKSSFYIVFGLWLMVVTIRVMWSAIV